MTVGELRFELLDLPDHAPVELLLDCGDGDTLLDASQIQVSAARGRLRFDVTLTQPEAEEMLRELRLREGELPPWSADA